MNEFLEYIKNLNPNYDLEEIKKAYEVADKMHKGQLRKSGEPYIIHPVEVAKILASLGMDEKTIAAGLLHDVVEDTEYTKDQMREEFGDEVTLLVDGVTKLGNLVFETREDAQAENFRKMFFAMSKDIRVLIIKLADRLHNMRTLIYMTPEKRKEISNETLEIYAPLANRLGMFAIKFELEDIALKWLQPEFYKNLAKQINERKEQREEYIKEIIAQLSESLDKLNIHYEVKGRSKHFYSIYRKMRDKHKKLDEIFDLTAIRVLVDTVKDCYAVLGVVHTMWRPVPGRFKDYIAMPKSNMYQSLHTTVFGSDAKPFEIQIRTYEMHQIAEYGIAAHWKYKEGITGHQNEEEKLSWLRQTLEWNRDMDDSRQFMETMKMDFFSNQVYVFTPLGKVIELPAGSTPIDFAYKIHSDVGNKCIGAKVNGKIVPIDHVLDNGNIVEITTSANSPGPKIDWLKIAKSSHARNKIRQWLKKENKSENAEKGKVQLDAYIHRKGYDTQQLIKTQRINRVARQMKFSSADDLYSSIGYGGTMTSKVLDLLLKFYDEEKRVEESRNEFKNFEPKQSKNKNVDAGGVSVKGVDNLLIRFSKCCNPVPGDEIVGFITKGRGVSVHRADCSNILAMGEEAKQRFIDVEWDTQKKNMSFDTEIYLLAEDRKGLFASLSKICDDMDVPITGVMGKTNSDNTAEFTITVQISNVNQIAQLIRRFKSIERMIDVHRTGA